MGVPVKRAIIFFKNNTTLGSVYVLLQQVTGEMDPSTASFAMCHSSLLPSDDLVLERRRDEITLFLASNRMLLGTDMSNIDLVIIVQPFDQPAAMLQAAGRMSRRTGKPYRTVGQFYVLFNSSDLATSNANMSDEVRRICREGSTTCTRELLDEVFKVDKSKWEKMAASSAGGEEQEGEVVARKEEELRTRKEEQLFKQLQQRVGDCRNSKQLLRLLQASPDLRQLLATSPMEEGSTSTDRGEGGEAQRHCCHKHDIEK